MVKQVLIVGAGPTGMVLALQLKRLGVDATVIDSRLAAGSGSKALSVNPASLDILDDLGVTEQLLARGKQNQSVNLIYEGQRLFKLDFKQLNSRFAYFLMLPQPDTEAALQARMAETGCEVARGTALVDLHQQGDQVQVTLSRDGQVYKETYDYVVGCDGARSRTRELLKLPFSGYDYDMHFVLADVKVRWNRDTSQSYYMVSEDGFFILLPLTEGYHRIVIKVSGAFDPKQTIDFDLIQAYLQRLDPDLEIFEPSWISSAPFYNRETSQFRRGNVFICGDACHLFSPIGGFGMNTGIGDAYNLAWKLAQVAKGEAPEVLLDSYDAERRQNAKSLLRLTDKNTSLIARLDRHSADDEALFTPKQKNRPFIRQFVQAAAGYQLDYAATGSAKGVGRIYLPLDLQGYRHQGTGYTLFASDAACAERLAQQVAYSGEQAQIQVCQRETVAHQFDPEAECVLVRPDKIIAFSGNERQCSRFLNDTLLLAESA
ncbi:MULTISPECIES: FAD-dependent monooxygenase [unclassified Pseudoalteromonas]|uniref:FAD-dependent oxidoreductase n=1 Tax=unclassified Pseudoalteromonas TaxID=194690 RepID=UPI002098213C|nr:FAD-dependent monooxygenase [Pseudoalteromonas sp. XMcav2-N]MCO7188676.1 FAD-dependent monooxygenase [Pseudoalteromonas sp. XMcav2-N]